MVYIIYKTTNKINNKIYIGKHKTENINDKYLGSGALLQKDINLFGIENFTKEILFIYATETEVNKKEKEIVNKSFCKRTDTYNLCLGGHGGFNYINTNNISKFKGKKHKKESLRQMIKTRIERGCLNPSEETRRKMKQNHWSKTNRSKFIQHMKKIAKEQIPSKETKKKISNALKGIKQEKIKCINCSKIGGVRAMKRYHLDKCKNNASVVSMVKPSASIN